MRYDYMIPVLRASAVLIAALSLGACAALPRVALPQMPKFSLPHFSASKLAGPEKLPPGVWVQARSDLKPDPDFRFGTLPNGMRYVLRRQTLPPGQAALRLRIDAGSLMERDDQSGLAHFLEHMAFNGSKAVPEGEMVKILERLGLAFGADTNASTNFNETVYKLDLPRTDAETVDTALMLLTETARNLTIEPAAVDRERGVVLSEERNRDTPFYRIYKARLAFLLKGQLPPKRLPIGQVEVLKTAPASRISDYYRAYYRPERTVLVAVGDLDLDATEAQIKARFGDWTGTGPAGPDPLLGAIAKRGPEAELTIEPGAPLSIQMAWIRTPDPTRDSVAKRKREIIARLGLSVINRRLSRISRAANPPFLGAGVFQSDEYDAVEQTLLLINAPASGWQVALSAAEKEQRRALLFGVRPDELAREISEARTGMEADVAAAATQTPRALANAAVDSLAENDVLTSPAQDLDLFNAVTRELTPETVNAAIKDAFKGTGPLVFMTSPQAIPGGKASLMAALAASQKEAVSAPEAPRQVSWPYTSFGTPGTVADRKEISDLDAVMVQFANGVHLTIKPTHFTDDEVLVRVNIEGGRLGLARDQPSTVWASGAFIEGGLARISAEDMERVLTDKVYGASFGISDEAFILSGSTRPGDLATELQVLTGYVAEPGWRPEAFARQKSDRKTLHDQLESTDSGILTRDLSGLLHSGDARWTVPSREQLAAATLDQFKASLAPALARAPLEVVIVGDVDVDKTIDAVAVTFGTLPQRQASTRAAETIAFPPATPTPLQRFHKGRADQTIGYLAWPTPDFFSDPQAARTTAILGEVLELRLTDELREAQGATYSPSVNYVQSFVLPGYGYLSASVEVPPGKLDSFFVDVRKIAADLRDRPVSADELARAKGPKVQQLEKARETNGFWLGELSGAQADPRRLDATRAAIAGTERITAADVQRQAQALLKDASLWMLTVQPEKAP